ncbi:hypothetical protein JW813_17590 (plasmid) [Clostridium botulinum]|uniref:hypothetical protein n=1 Tax=Clostridium botulinum TaxID=1491 RepID=UPI002245EB52|nr:hypothetical protein [Clostridium botulinum]UZP05171.1 hypothetical protein JW813_17590 [Clostridium botulinum]UZP08559.1 hypothetical protein JYA71_17855 [Clostridium botulinum]UZP11928.1 hypothetical protein JYA74_17605 [Clostridium botulinum]
MFVNIATNIKDVDKLKGMINDKLNINIDTYEKREYNLTDILSTEKEDREKLINDMNRYLIIGREDNIIVILFYDNVEDVKLMDNYNIIVNNTFTFENIN